MRFVTLILKALLVGIIAGFVCMLIGGAVGSLFPDQDGNQYNSWAMAAYGAILGAIVGFIVTIIVGLRRKTN